MKIRYKKSSLGLIPEEWNICRFDDVISFMKSGLSRKLSDEDIGIPCIRSSNIINNKISDSDLKYWYLEDDKGADINAYKLDDGDILVNFINSMAQIGKACRYYDIGREVIYTTNIFRIKVDEDLIEPDYFYFNTLTENYNKQVELITKPAVNQASFTSGDFKSIKMILPPLPEQKKIAKILSTVDGHIDEVDGMIEDLKELKKGLMQKLLTEGIGHTEFKDSEVGRIPVEWEVMTGNEIIKKVSKSSYKQLKTKDYLVEGKTPIVDQGQNRIAGFTNVAEGIIIDNLPLVIFGDHTRIVKFVDFPFAVGADGTQVLYPIKSIDRVFFYYALSNLKISNEGYSRHFKFVKEGKFAIPSIKEQIKIAKILSSLDERLKQFTEEKNDVELLKKGLMQQLLTGKTRVKTDNKEVITCRI